MRDAPQIQCRLLQVMDNCNNSDITCHWAEITAHVSRTSQNLVLNNIAQRLVPQRSPFSIH